MSNKSLKTDDWYVYIVRCSDSTLYTGITNDLERRVDEHNCKKSGARYTRSRRPVELVYYERVESKSSALKREHLVRTQNLKKKKDMILTSCKDANATNLKVKLSTSAIRKIRKTA